MQKSRTGTYVQFVFVWFTGEEGVEDKHQKYYSCSYTRVFNYMTNKDKAYFLIANEMVSKDSPKYQAWLRKMNLMKKKQKQSANDPLPTKMPLNLK